MTKPQATAYNEVRKILAYYYRGHITQKEMLKGMFKATAKHRYNDAWLDAVDIALHSKSVNDFDSKLVIYFTVINNA